ncbi:MAG: hypothetical protein MJZ19_04165 [Paludibacteraceae bacterium]|nr:hypothetical protein [Paludibacteraceae bacterium]
MKEKLSNWLSKFSWKKIKSGYTFSQLLSKYAGELMFGVVLCVLLIHNQYVCNDYVSQLAKCEVQLKNYKFEALTKKSQLTKKIQQSHVKHLVDEKGLRLVESTYPPYVLDK